MPFRPPESGRRIKTGWQHQPQQKRGAAIPVQERSTNHESRGSLHLLSRRLIRGLTRKLDATCHIDKAAQSGYRFNHAACKQDQKWMSDNRPRHILRMHGSMRLIREERP